MATYAFESVTVTGTAGGLTAATFDNSNSALITVETAAVRFRLDGTVPTASIGHELEAGDVLFLESNDEIQRVSFIRRDGVSATIRVTYGV